MKYVLVRQSRQLASPFSDLISTVNRQGQPLGFYQRIEPSMRIVRNRTLNNTDSPFAIARYHVDPWMKVQPSNYFRGINVSVIEQLMSKYDHVVYGRINHGTTVADHTSLDLAVYVAKDQDGNLINAQTEELIGPDVTIVSFYALVRIQNLPVYYLIVNSNLVSVTDGFNFHHPETDTSWILLSEDNSFRDSVLSPTVTGGTLVGNTIIRSTTGHGVTLQLFSTGILRNENIDLFNLKYTIKSSLECSSYGDCVLIADSGKPGYVKIKFDFNQYFADSTTDSQTLEYVIV